MIKENVQDILRRLPAGVLLQAAAKSRSTSEIEEAVSAGVKIIGENYVQEAAGKFAVLGNKVKWHFIGHLQKNKVKQAVRIFDMIETMDSLKLASVLDKQCAKIKKVMPVLIEINSAREPQKSGVLPRDALNIAQELSKFKNLKLEGLMTLGPFTECPEDARPFFKQTREIFDTIREKLGSRLDWRYLSMGMSDTYRIALEEGANIVRIGTAIFGPR